VTFIPNEPWFLSLPACSAAVPCGPGEHTLRWEAGQLHLPSHPDAEAEMVLAALGGEKAGCVQLAEAWGRHAEDLAVLQIGPRGPGDQITVGWEDVPPETEQGGTGPGGAGPGGTGHVGWAALAGPPVAMPGSMRFPLSPGHGPQQFRQAMATQLKQAQQRTRDLLSLLALGPAFGFRLAGQVAAAHADRLAPENRPALTAAIAGRLALVAEDWIGIVPGQVTGTLHRGDVGWGSVEMTGEGPAWRLRVALPAGWLASVWACGLALVAGHLVVAVVRPGWPDAQVLAVRSPGSEPVLLDVHGTEGGTDNAHWET
jgi:hypothetical protein